MKLQLPLLFGLGLGATSACGGDDGGLSPLPSGASLTLDGTTIEYPETLNNGSVGREASGPGGAFVAMSLPGASPSGTITLTTEDARIEPMLTRGDVSGAAAELAATMVGGDIPAGSRQLLDGGPGTGCRFDATFSRTINLTPSTTADLYVIEATCTGVGWSNVTDTEEIGSGTYGTVATRFECAVTQLMR